jgi:hypothetical protein
LISGAQIHEISHDKPQSSRRNSLWGLLPWLTDTTPKASKLSKEERRTPKFEEHHDIDELSFEIQHIPTPSTKKNGLPSNTPKNSENVRSNLPKPTTLKKQDMTTDHTVTNHSTIPKLSGLPSIPKTPLSFTAPEKDLKNGPSAPDSDASSVIESHLDKEVCELLNSKIETDRVFQTNIERDSVVYSLKTGDILDMKEHISNDDNVDVNIEYIPMLEDTSFVQSYEDDIECISEPLFSLSSRASINEERLEDLNCDEMLNLSLSSRPRINDVEDLNCVEMLNLLSKTACSLNKMDSSNTISEEVDNHAENNKNHKTDLDFMKALDVVNDDTNTDGLTVKTSNNHRNISQDNFEDLNKVVYNFDNFENNIDHTTPRQKQKGAEEFDPFQLDQSARKQDWMMSFESPNSSKTTQMNIKPLFRYIPKSLLDAEPESPLSVIKYTQVFTN